jgi:hypothetical protein
MPATPTCTVTVVVQFAAQPLASETDANIVWDPGPKMVVKATVALVGGPPEGTALV